MDGVAVHGRSDETDETQTVTAATGAETTVSTQAQPRPARSRNRVVAIAVAAAVGTGAIGIGVGSRLRNPDSVLPKAPNASRLAVPVEMRTLRTTLVTRGSGQLAGFLSVTVSLTGSGASVVTRTASVGDRPDEGDVLLAVDDSPMFLFVGRIPAFRDLKPGDTGRDVAQLNAALARLGLRRAGSAPDDRYDERTEAAVEQLYRDRGAVPFGPKPDELDQLAAARKAVNDADLTVLRARRELADASKPPGDDSLIGARETLAAAEDAVDGLPVELNRLRTDAESAVRAKQRALLDAEAAARKAASDLEEARRASTDPTPILTAERAALEARAKVDAAKEAVEVAIVAVRDAGDDAQAAKEAIPVAKEVAASLRVKADQVAADRDRLRVNGPRIPSDGSIITESEIQAQFTAADDAVREANNAARSAELAVKSAEREATAKQRAITTAERAVLTAKQGVVDAESAVVAADRAVEKAKREASQRADQVAVDESTKPGAATDAVSAAQAELETATAALDRIETVVTARRRAVIAQRDSARAALARLSKQPDLANLSAQLSGAETARAQVQRSLEQLDAKIGFVLPMSGYLFVPDMPVQVMSVDTQPGQLVTTSSVLTIAGGGLGIDAVVENSDRSYIKPGTTAAIEFPDFSVTGTAVVRSVSGRPDRNDPSVTPFQLAIDSASLRSATGDTIVPAAFSGASAKVTIELSAMKQPGLVVPIAAVVTRADRSTVVLVERDPTEPLVEVPVRTRETGDGLVHVEPLDGAALRAGDLVQVTAEAAEAAAAGGDSDGEAGESGGSPAPPEGESP
jgi:multidrug efflux pump subunit AcrA (membrane-fusion protein)/peptidoglycan hydrolase-like protein with peptidoglycan-binding domain